MNKNEVIDTHPSSTRSLKHINKDLGLVFTSSVGNLDSSAHSKALLAPIFGYIKEIMKNGLNCEEQAQKYFELYGTEAQITLEAKELQRLIPNIPITGDTKLLKLYGMEKIGTDPNSTKYLFRPHKFILATLINSVNYMNFTERIKFAFQVYDEDGNGAITKDELAKNLKFYGTESQFYLDNDAVEKIVEAIYRVIDKNFDERIHPWELEGFFRDKSYHKDLKVAQFSKGLAVHPLDSPKVAREPQNSDSTSLVHR